MSTRPFPRLRIPAPAKVNRGLAIGPRRADGYHEIDSLFLPIDLFDTVELEPASELVRDVEVVGAPGDLPVDERNLARRAADAYPHRAELPAGVRIRVEKRIPIGAGLGGGSSDAGAVLRGLAAWGGRPASDPEIAAAAARVGADVPFFLDPRPARVRGFGDRIDPVPVSGVAGAMVVVWPRVSISTAWAYAAVDERRLTSPEAADRIRRFHVGGGKRADFLNDFEDVVLDSFPEVRKAKERLLEVGAEEAWLSGSGSAVVGSFGGEDAARSAEKLLRKEGNWAKVAHVLPRGVEPPAATRG